MKTRQCPAQGGFSCTVRSNDGEHLTVRETKADVINGLKLTVVYYETLDFYEGVRHRGIVSTMDLPPK